MKVDLSTQLSAIAEDDSGHFPIVAKRACGEAADEIERLRAALNLTLLRMRGVAMEHKTHGRPDLGAVAERWAEDINATLTQ